MNRFKRKIIKKIKALVEKKKSLKKKNELYSFISTCIVLSLV